MKPYSLPVFFARVILKLGPLLRDLYYVFCYLIYASTAQWEEQNSILFPHYPLNQLEYSSNKNHHLEMADTIAF